MVDSKTKQNKKRLSSIWAFKNAEPLVKVTFGQRGQGANKFSVYRTWSHTLGLEQQLVAPSHTFSKEV